MVCLRKQINTEFNCWPFLPYLLIFTNWRNGKKFILSGKASTTLSCFYLKVCNSSVLCQNSTHKHLDYLYSHKVSQWSSTLMAFWRLSLMTIWASIVNFLEIHLFVRVWQTNLNEVWGCFSLLNLKRNKFRLRT